MLGTTAPFCLKPSMTLSNWEIVSAVTTEFPETQPAHNTIAKQCLNTFENVIHFCGNEIYLRK